MNSFAWTLHTTNEKDVLILNNAIFEHFITLCGTSQCIEITGVHLSRAWYGEQTLFALV